MNKLSNIKAECSYMTSDGYSSVWVGWEKNGARYHVWINEKKGKREPIEKLFKNPLEGIKTGEPGDFRTRILKPFNAANKTDVEYALKIADVEKAKAEYLAKEQRERDEREAERKEKVKRDKLNAAAPDLLACLKNMVKDGNLCIQDEIAAEAAIEKAERGAE
jgi:hypothetical protein